MFKPGQLLSLLIVTLIWPCTAIARDATQRYSIADAMMHEVATGLTDVNFYWGDQEHPEIEKTIGTYETRRKTGAFGRSDYKACRWAFLAAVKVLHSRALKEGGDAVVNIRSTVTGTEFSSKDEFICRDGNIVTKVYLKGDVVLLKDKSPSY